MFGVKKHQVMIDLKTRLSILQGILKTAVVFTFKAITVTGLITLLFGSIATIKEIAAYQGIGYWDNIVAAFPFALVSIIILLACWFMFMPVTGPDIAAKIADLFSVKHQNSELNSEEHRQAIVLHEVGHGLCHLAYLWPLEELKLHCIPITLPDGTIHGQAISIPEDKDVEQPEHYVASMKVCLGGYMAEQVFGDGKVRMGAEGDLGLFERQAKAWLGCKANLDKTFIWFHAPSNEQEMLNNKNKINELQVKYENEVKAFLSCNEELFLKLSRDLLTKKELIYRGQALRSLREKLKGISKC